MPLRCFLSAAVLLGFWSSPEATAVRANLVAQSVRLVDNGDNDGFADPNETVNVFVTLRNRSGNDRQGIVVRMAGTDPTVACIPTPVVAFGALLAGEVREASVPLVLRVADVTRLDPVQDLSLSLEFVISGDDFNTTTYPQTVTLDVDLNASGGFLPTTYTEGFEGANFGTFTAMSLDTGKASVALSDGFRCQYNDPDFVNSNSYGSTFCYLGFTAPANNAFDWHVHGLASPDGGRAYLGNNSLHWGVHPGAASADTTRLKQLDAIRTTNTINLGWNGVSSVLSFKHQVGLSDCDYVECAPGFTADRGIVQVQLANSAGMAVGNWRKISPYQNLYDSQPVDIYRECLFDPTDDGNTEDDYFDPTDPERRLGPSSTCNPEFVFSRQGAIFWSDTFDPADIHHASDGPGLQGSRGPGTWVETRFDLSRYRGWRLRMRFLATSIEVTDAVTMQQALSWNPIEADDGWYIDDVQVTNTLVSAATVTVDTADRSGLPACGPVCTEVTPSLVATPAIAECGEAFTLDASGSTADQCPGGALQFRFWWMSPDLFPEGGVNERHALLLQDWNENGILSHAEIEAPMLRYQVDVRCSTLPACGASLTWVVPVDPASYVSVPFPHTIGFDTPSTISVGGNVYFAAVRGDLGALRATGGNFDGSVETCLARAVRNTTLVDPSVPAPGQGMYYLLRTPFTDTNCTFHSWSTGRAAEMPGAGGNRDQDLALDPDSCVGFDF